MSLRTTKATLAPLILFHASDRAAMLEAVASHIDLTHKGPVAGEAAPLGIAPEGTPFGAELIRRELELTRAAGKPVVVSMGNVAASGGYWVATAGDFIYAEPSTITGSIGV